jgi:CRISPR type IV-associated protein Csf3
MNYLKITAYLNNGFVATYDWSLTIDGIVGYAKKLEELGFEDFVLTQSINDMKPLDDLPFQKEEFNGNWWYQCSRPLFKTVLTKDKYNYRRFNQFEAEIYVNKVKKVEATKGPYRNARVLKNHIITSEINWFVCGDKKEIERLLKTITHIGGARSSGCGSVKNWEVEVINKTEKCRFCRVLPVEFAKLHGIDGPVLNWSIRPPSTLKENQFDCVIPENIYDRS